MDIFEATKTLEKQGLTVMMSVNNEGHNRYLVGPEGNSFLTGLRLKEHSLTGLELIDLAQRIDKQLRAKKS